MSIDLKKLLSDAINSGMAEGIRAASNTITATVEDPTGKVLSEETRLVLAGIAGILSEQAAVIDAQVKA